MTEAVGYFELVMQAYEGDREASDIAKRLFELINGHSQLRALLGLYRAPHLMQRSGVNNLIKRCYQYLKMSRSHRFSRYIRH